MTLIIHPSDTSTDFLKPIYQSMPVDSYTLVDTNMDFNELNTLINLHDRIIMLGHGDAWGLFGFDDYMVNKSFVSSLRNKPDNVYIWCNADKFVAGHKLKGFATGMIISEHDEAVMMCIKPDEVEIAESNSLFTQSITNAIHLPKQLMVESIAKDYNSIHNPIIRYNQNNIYHF